jgi:hypothetical protein
MMLDVGMPGLQQRIFLFLVLVWLSLVAYRLAQWRRTQNADN